MKKYYIGLFILFLVVAGLFGYTLYQGNIAKKDKVISTKAQEIAEKLNNYVSEKNEIPASLQTIGVTDVPAGIKYTRVSDERYTFCVTYGASSRGYGVGATELATAAFFNRFYGAGNPGYPAYSSDLEDSQLYIYNYGGHNKGETCYKVKPYLSSSSTYPTNQYYCDPSYQYYEYFKSTCDGSSLNLMQN